jgi:hypothetical protein
LSMRRGKGDQTHEQAEKGMFRPKSHNDPVQSIGPRLEHFEASRRHFRVTFTLS